MIILDLLYNLSVLVALSVFSGFIDQRFNRTELIGKLLQGLLFGTTAIIGMLYPFVLTEGIIFDGRSIIISLCTLFFGPVSGALAAIIAIVFRIHLGGGGALMGVLVITTSFLIGFIFYSFRRKQNNKQITNIQFYIFGLWVHIAMLIFVLALPQKNIIEAYKTLTITVIGVFPIVTILIGKILYDQENNQNFIKQIKESEEKYRLLVENQTDLVVKTDVNGKYLFANAAYCDLFDLKEEELIGKSYTPLVHEDDIAVVEEAIAKLFKPPYTCSYEERAKTKSGWRWIQWEAKSVIDKNGNVVELIGAGRDVTTRKEAEIKLTKRLELERILASISSRFISVESQFIDDEINNALAKIGKSASVDRAYLFQITEDGLYYYNSHEWCAEGIIPQKDNLQRVALNAIPWWTELLHKAKVIHVPKVSELPQEAIAEREILEAQDIKSVIVIPVNIGENFSGFFGFDSVKVEKFWADEDILLLKMLGEIFSNALNRMKSKEALKNLLTKQSAILIAIPDMIFTVTRSGILTDYSSPDPLMLAKEPAEFLNKHLSSFFPLDLSDIFRGLIHKSLSTNQLQQYEYSLEVRGQLKYYEARIAPAGNDNTIFIVRDITEKNRADQELIKLKRAIEQSSISVIITNQSGSIEYVNPFFTELTGYTPEEVMGKNPRILKSGFHSTEFYKSLWKDLKSGKDWQGEILNKRKNGETYWEYTVISPILNKEGIITHFVAIQEDITQQKKMLEDLIAAKDKAEEMNRIKSLFFANMSHELRTPMIGILGNAELLELELFEKHHREMARTIYRSALRLHETLNAILDISKIEVEGIQKSVRLVNINSLIEECISLFYATAVEKGLKINYEKGFEAISMITDDNLLTKILNNLLSNAIKYSDTGTITIKSEFENNRLRIEVADNGIGIAENNLSLIFEPFRQTSEGYSRKYEGTGLGLAITKRFIETLEGTITVESFPGKGSKFSIDIPNDVLEISDKETDTSSDISPIKNTHDNIKLLLVEDEHINAEVILRLLRDKYQVDWVQLGKDAVLKAIENKYDAVLMDIGLRGDMDGLEAAREIRKLNNYKNVPIIAVTAYAMEGDREKFLECGCTHYIPKPFQKNELIKMIETALS